MYLLVLFTKVCFWSFDDPNGLDYDITKNNNVRNNYIFDLSQRDILISVFSGIAGFCCSSMFTLANQLEKASRVASLDFTEVIFGYWIDWMFFATSISGYDLFGCFVIVICGVFTFYLSYKNDQLSSFDTGYWEQDYLSTPLLDKSHPMKHINKPSLDTDRGSITINKLDACENGCNRDTK